MNQERIQEKQTRKKENIFVVFDFSTKAKEEANIYNINTLFYLVLTLGKVLMIETLQRFHWHEQHMFKVDPNFSITHLSHLLSQILYKMKILN